MESKTEPEAVYTVRLVLPVGSGGAMASISVFETTVKDSAGAVPNRTDLTAVRLVPVTTTLWPPSALKDDVDKLLIVGVDDLETTLAVTAVDVYSNCSAKVEAG